MTTDQRAAWREIASRWCPVGSSREEEERYINRMLGAIAEAVAQAKEEWLKHSLACQAEAVALERERCAEQLSRMMCRAKGIAEDDPTDGSPNWWMFHDKAIRALGEGE